MRRALALILLVVVGLSGSNRLVCQIFDSNNKSFQQYCADYYGSLPRICANDTNSAFESFQVNQLKIGGCDEEFVLDLAKRYQQNLRALDISYSGYSSLNWFNSTNLTFNKLQIFNASNNGLTDMRLSFLLRFQELVEIDLSHNDIMGTYFELEKMKKLRKLHLSHNNLKYLMMSAFPLESIDYLDLRSNRIKYIREADSNGYKNLKEFHLENNPFRVVQCDLINSIFDGRLTALYISWNNLERFWGLCKNNCQEKQMRIVRINDTSEGIFVTSNGAYEIRCTNKCFENVHSFGAGCNNFQNANEVINNMGSVVEHINLSRNFIGELSASVLDRFPKLNSLELSETNLTWFDFDMLWNEKENMTVIDVSNNNLKQTNNIPSLRYFINLQELIMGGNQIENAYEAIEYLNPSIKNLDLSGGNIVGKVNVITFQRLAGLKRLNLSNTNLVLPDSNPFEMLQNLKVLDLSQNNLENFNFSILSATLYNLTELRLAGCRIKDIAVFETVIQYLGPNLTKLDLSKNPAHENINSFNFDLNSLKLQQNLTFLDISNNKLKIVDFNLFPFVKHIHINLEDNDLDDLTNFHQRNSEEPWATLKLANNQIPCTHLKKLKNDYETEISLAGDSWHQKPDKDCRTSTESIKGFMVNVYDTIKFW